MKIFILILILANSNIPLASYETLGQCLDAKEDVRVVRGNAEFGELVCVEVTIKK